MNDSTSTNVERQVQQPKYATSHHLPVLREIDRKSAPQWDIIRQTEMQDYLSELNCLQRRMMHFRKRVQAGAIVELGTLSAELLPGPVSPVVDADELELHGLRIGPASSS